MCNGMLQKQQSWLRLIGVQVGSCQWQPAIGICLAVVTDCHRQGPLMNTY